MQPQLENKQIYMDLHLNIPATPEGAGPQDVITTVRKQRVRSTPSNQMPKKFMVLDSPQRLPEKLSEIQDIFLSTKPLPNSGKLYMKHLVQHFMHKLSGFTNSKKSDSKSAEFRRPTIHPMPDGCNTHSHTLLMHDKYSKKCSVQDLATNWSYAGWISKMAQGHRH
jgi:hypothetical protein